MKLRNFSKESTTVLRGLFTTKTRQEAEAEKPSAIRQMELVKIKKELKKRGAFEWGRTLPEGYKKKAVKEMTVSGLRQAVAKSKDPAKAQAAKAELKRRGK